MKTVDEILDEARGLVDPSREEERKVESLAERVVNAAQRLFSSVTGFNAATLEGSAAKGTWIRSRPEVDVFVHFSPATPRDEVEKVVISKGVELVKELGGDSKLRYADHPYVEGVIEDITVNVVACYDTTPGNWLSPVDRTPYHTRYINSKLSKELRSDVRLLKSLLMSIGVYGAEIKVGGFSGYLSELLVLNFGSFKELVERASKWRPPVYVDIERLSNKRVALTLFQNSPLIVIDPVDPRRNVAAAVTLTKLSEFILASKLFAKEPSIDYFKLGELRSVEEGKFGLDMTERNVLMVRFHIKEYIPPDVLWGELYKSAKSVKRTLELEGFKPFRFAVMEGGGEIVMLYEFENRSLPSVRLHEGPPVYMDNALDFVRKHVNAADTLAGPWVDGEHLYVLKRRAVKGPDEVVRERLISEKVSLPRDLKDAIKAAEVTARSEEILSVASRDKNFANFLREFLIGRPSFLKRHAS